MKTRLPMAMVNKLRDHVKVPLKSKYNKKAERQTIKKELRQWTA